MKKFCDLRRPLTTVNDLKDRNAKDRKELKLITLSMKWTVQNMIFKNPKKERESVGTWTQASSINSGFLHWEPPSQNDVGSQWNAFSSRLSMKIYRFLNSMCEEGIEYSDCGMFQAIQTDEQLEYAKSSYPTHEELTCESKVPRLISTR